MLNGSSTGPSLKHQSFKGWASSRWVVQELTLLSSLPCYTGSSMPWAGLGGQTGLTQLHRVTLCLWLRIGNWHTRQKCECVHICEEECEGEKGGLQSQTLVIPALVTLVTCTTEDQNTSSTFLIGKENQKNELSVKKWKVKKGNKINLGPER